MPTLTLARRSEARLPATLVDGMHRLRADVFHRRLGWEVRVHAGREIDAFDRLDPYYLVAHEGPVALGCARLLPTTGPNMLRDVFPRLIGAGTMPCSPSVWEVSRFAVARAAGGRHPRFGPLPASMVAELLHFSHARGATSVVGATSTAFERLLRGLALEVRRLGPTCRIGNVTSLAFELPLHACNMARLAAHRKPPELARAA